MMSFVGKNVFIMAMGRQRDGEAEGWRKQCFVDIAIKGFNLSHLLLFMLLVVLKICQI